MAAILVSPMEGAAEACRIHNDYILDWARAGKGRLRPVAMVPTQTVEGALAEAKRTIDAGAYAINVSSGRPPGGLSPADPAWGRVALYASRTWRWNSSMRLRVIGPDWGGTLSHDGFASYGRFEGAVHQQCAGHVLRRARDMLGWAARGAVRFPRQVVALFTEAIHWRNRFRRRGAGGGAGGAA